MRKKKPEITPENYRAVYKFYEPKRQTKLGASVMSRLVGLDINTHLSFDKGVEEEITQELKLGRRRLVVAAHHVSLKDPRVVAQIPLKSKACKDMNGNTFVGAKASLFNSKIPILGDLLRKSVEALGAIPVFRAKDMKKGDVSDTMLKRSRGEFVLSSAKKIINGENMAIFPRGEREKEEPLSVNSLFDGVGKIVCRAGRDKDAEQPLIMPVGIYYLDEERMQAYIHVGKLSTGNFENSEEVMEWLEPNMQTAVDSAYGQAQTDLMSAVFSRQFSPDTHEHSLA